MQLIVGKITNARLIVRLIVGITNNDYYEFGPSGPW